MIWQTSRFAIDLTRPQVMGIVNVTPDSFSDGGLRFTSAAALAHCERLLKDGAGILDIGGESTRPGALPVPAEEELARVLPVLESAVKLGVPISLDTYKPQVMRAALDLGVDIINDVWALRWLDEALPADQLTGPQVVAGHPSCGVCLMHMHGEPGTMQRSTMQGDAVVPVLSFLGRAARALKQQGVARERIAVDPGIGFGKTVQQNFSLLSRQRQLLVLGYPVVVGWSRKSSLAALISTSLSNVARLDNQSRLVPSVAAALLAVERGAHVVRVHDVRETVQALKVLASLEPVAAPAEAPAARINE
jgi:dihydropteroate synthase